MNREIFLVSSPIAGPGEPFTDQNKFLERIRDSVFTCNNCLFITSNPDDIEFTDGFSSAILYTMKHSGMELDAIHVLDRRNSKTAKKLVLESDFIILAGGHVPTQNRFFQEIGLRNLMKSYKGVVLGISAGSMNSADIVYAQPEKEGESVDIEYKRFLDGLGLTKHMILPHYQDTKERILDGKKLFEDITYPDSHGREFYALPDGSYLYIKDGKERICGEAYLIKDGVCKCICSDGEEYWLQ